MEVLEIKCSDLGSDDWDLEGAGGGKRHGREAPQRFLRFQSKRKESKEI